MAEFGSRLDINTRPFVLHTFPGARQDKATLLQDGGRAIDLAQYTLMAQITTAGATFGKWVPYISLTATDGTAVPSGIYMGEDIASADIVAGDVLDLPITITGIRFDEDKLVFDAGTLSYDDEFASSNATAVYAKKTVREILIEKHLIPQLTGSNTSFENA